MVELEYWVVQVGTGRDPRRLLQKVGGDLEMGMGQLEGVGEGEKYTRGRLGGGVRLKVGTETGD